tara:strand:- start:229 stop:495 length:267 start_codon:yes stop_codon:yes gene_type:complete
MTGTLKVGDYVGYRANYGLSELQVGKVTALTVTTEPHSKVGTDVDEVSWDVVERDCCIATIDNGPGTLPSWAYGTQVAPLGQDPRDRE